MLRQVLQGHFQRLARMLAARQIAPLPTLTYSFAKIHTAMRQFANAKHIGKIVVEVAGATGDEGRGCSKSPGQWMIPGGLGALGQIVAEWLAGEGHKYLSLLGRSGRHASATPLLCMSNPRHLLVAVPSHSHTSACDCSWAALNAPEGHAMKRRGQCTKAVLAHTLVMTGPCACPGLSYD